MIKKTPPLWLGALIYIVMRPFIWLAVKGTTRAYVLVIAEGSILLTKNWLGLHKKWRLPGGGAKKSEDPSLAAERELFEEVGIKIDRSQLKALICDPKTISNNFKSYIYVINFSSKQGINRNRLELSDAQWISLDKISSINVSKEVTAALKANS